MKRIQSRFFGMGLPLGILFLLTSFALLPDLQAAELQTTAHDAAANPQPSDLSLKSLTGPVKEALVEPVELRTSLLKTQEYPIDLAAVLQLVVDQNLLLAQSRKNTEILQSRLRQAQVSILPNIDGVYTQSRLEGGQQIFGGETISVIRTTVQPQVTASWTLHPGGRTIYQMLAAKRRKQAADFTLKDTYQEQLARAAEEYYKLLAAYMQKGVVVRSIEEAREQVQLNQLKTKIGQGIPLDLSRAKTRYAQQQTALIQAESNIIQAEQLLLNRLNLDPTIHLMPNEMDALKKPLISLEVPFKHLMTEAIASNPLLKTNAEELKALDFDYKTVRSDLIPSFTLRTYTNLTGADWSNTVRTNFSGVTVNVNLLQNLGLQIPFQMQERKKLLEQKVLERQSLIRNIESQVTMAYLNSQNYESAIASAEQELNSARESYELSVGRFASGYGINLDVLSAQLALETARSNLVQAILNYNQSQVQLVEAMGQIAPDILLKGLQMQGNASNGNTSNQKDKDAEPKS